MNVSEASAANTVLCHLLAIDGPMRERRPSSEELREACRLLANNAHRALMAGILPAEVDDAFERDRVARRPRATARR